jgi:hypothetical protein
MPKFCVLVTVSHLHPTPTFVGKMERTQVNTLIWWSTLSVGLQILVRLGCKGLTVNEAS